jgi:hypothetical protein
MPYADPIVGGIFLIKPAIRSRNYIAGVSGWTINVDGSAEFNNVTVRGGLIVSDGNSTIRIDTALFGTPTVTFFISGITNPAQFFAFNAAATAGHSANVGLSLFASNNTLDSNNAMSISLSNQTLNMGYGTATAGPHITIDNSVLANPSIRVASDLSTAGGVANQFFIDQNGATLSGGLTIQSGIGAVLTVRKNGGSTPRTAVTVLADPDLSLTVEGGAIYEMTTYIVYDGINTTGTGVGGIVYGWTGPAGAVMDWNGGGYNTTVPSAPFLEVTSTSQVIGGLPSSATRGAGTQMMLRMYGILVTAVGNPGSFTFRWGQLNVSATPVTVYGPSRIVLRRIG